MINNAYFTTYMQLQNRVERVPIIFSLPKKTLVTSFFMIMFLGGFQQNLYGNARNVHTTNNHGQTGAKTISKKVSNSFIYKCLRGSLSSLAGLSVC